MSKIQNRLKGLQPYLVQLRFPEGNPVVDMVFKKGWHVPQSEVIGSTKGDSEDLNYHMFYGGHDEVELDDILDFIEKVIALNIEREKKHELLKAKAKELQDLFRKNPLSKLQGMKFVLGGEKLVQDMTPDPLDVVDFNIDEQLTEQPQSTSVEKPQPTPVNRPQPEVVESPQPTPQPEVVQEENVRRAPNGEIIPPLTPEDTGELEDEFDKFDLTSKEPETRSVGGKKIDLPPKKENKKRVELLEIEEPTNVTCKCEPEDVCPACEETKIGSY
jgi:hypothetical protein